jgi:hypothetical protein
MRAPEVDPGDAARVRYALRNVPGDEPAKYRAAIQRVRAQTGQADRFAEAIRISGMFMPGIERIIEERGLPLVISRLPFVESMFNYRARSKVGASGAWQFTASTGRMYLQMNAAVDARSDVFLAADGAARKLAREYDLLGTWPLTLTAYNHGAAGMARAVRQTGTRDIARIVEEYDGRSFGFASRNFYAEFVAAVAVYEEREQLFPGIEPMPPLRFDEFSAPRYFSVLDLAQLTQSSLRELGELNPALAVDVLRGELLVPPATRCACRRAPRPRSSSPTTTCRTTAGPTASSPPSIGCRRATRWARSPAASGSASPRCSAPTTCRGQTASTSGSGCRSRAALRGGRSPRRCSPRSPWPRPTVPPVLPSRGSRPRRPTPSSTSCSVARPCRGSPRATG